MLRIHFNAEDLTRISIAAAADPLWEIVLSRITLQERYPPPQFVPWWKAVRDDPWRRARVEPGARVLATLAPLGPYFPDFLTPSDASLDLDSGLERVCGTPRRRIRGEFERFTRTSRVPMPSWVRPLADADSSALTRLTILLRDYYRSAIAPQGRLVRSAVEADRARRARAALDSGVEGLLASFGPLMCWRPPVLEVRYDVDRELHLGGRGLRLVPSYFCHGSPVALADPDLLPVLVYPISEECRWAAIGDADLQAVEKLLGATRTAILAAMIRATSTTQLARSVGVSPASASRHTAVLRAAGLIRTVRDRQAVLHTRTPLGTAILERCLIEHTTGQRSSQAGFRQSLT